VKHVPVIAIALLLLAAIAQGADKPSPVDHFKRHDVITGKVVDKDGIHDGDTFRVLADDGNTYRVRIWAIDAPEFKGHDLSGHNWINQPYCEEARDELISLLYRNQVRCEVVSRSHDRVVCTVTLTDGRDISSEMTKRGACWIDPVYAKGGELPKYQASAKAAGKGLWGKSGNPTPPTPPWDWRKGKR
jgi:micrococcal nuclease